MYVLGCCLPYNCFPCIITVGFSWPVHEDIQVHDNFGISAKYWPMNSSWTTRVCTYHTGKSHMHEPFLDTVLLHYRDKRWDKEGEERDRQTEAERQWNRETERERKEEKNWGLGEVRATLNHVSTSKYNSFSLWTEWRYGYISACVIGNLLLLIAMTRVSYSLYPDKIYFPM